MRVRDEGARRQQPFMTEPIECVACVSRDVSAVKEWPTKKPARAIACRACGLLFVHPQDPRETPNPSDTPDVQPQTSSPPDSTTAPAKKGVADVLIAALDRHFHASRPATGARVLDVRCGSGAWLNAFLGCGWDTFGIGHSTDAAFARHKRLTAVPTDPQFDLVIALQVLQRLPRPLDTLRQISRALHNGGHCLVSVPRLETLAVHRDIPFCLGKRTSMVAFTEACLRGLLARVGLEVVAALHDLDDAWTNGEPLQLRLLARKVETATPEPDPAAALEPVLRAVSLLSEAPVPTAPIECPACAGRNVQRFEEWRLSKIRTRAAGCLDCGLLFVHPQPTREVLDAYYAPEGGWQASRSESPRPPQTRTKGAAPDMMADLDRYFMASRPAAGAKVLDFGCGTGKWLNSFHDYGWETYGIEPSTDAAFVRHRRLLAIPTEPEFDLALVYHVLEHLPRPLDTLRELARVLLPGGHLLVSVPRLDMLPVHRQVEYCLHVRHHIVAFTEPCLRGLLARAGLEVVASFHELPSSFKNGLPTKLRLLARKSSTSPALEPNPASALKPVLDAFAEINSQHR